MSEEVGFLVMLPHESSINAVRVQAKIREGSWVAGLHQCVFKHPEIVPCDEHDPAVVLPFIHSVQPWQVYR